MYVSEYLRVTTELVYFQNISFEIGPKYSSKEMKDANTIKTLTCLINSKNLSEATGWRIKYYIFRV